MDTLIAMALWLMSTVVTARFTHNVSGKTAELMVNYFVVLASTIISLASVFVIVSNISGNPQSMGIVLLSPVSPILAIYFADWLGVRHEGQVVFPKA